MVIAGCALIPEECATFVNTQEKTESKDGAHDKLRGHCKARIYRYTGEP